jgi:hypothetical protein
MRKGEKNESEKEKWKGKSKSRFAVVLKVISPKDFHPKYTPKLIKLPRKLFDGLVIAHFKHTYTYAYFSSLTNQELKNINFPSH